MCVAMLEALLNEKFLCRTSEGLFARSAILNESTTDGTGGRGSTVPQGGQIGVSMIERNVPRLNDAERESLERIIRFAGWLPKGHCQVEAKARNCGPICRVRKCTRPQSLGGRSTEFSST